MRVIHRGNEEVWSGHKIYDRDRKIYEFCRKYFKTLPDYQLSPDTFNKRRGMGGVCARA